MTVDATAAHAERTALAWRRSALAVVGLGAVVVRAAGQLAGPAWATTVTAVGVLGVTLAAATWWCGARPSPSMERAPSVPGLVTRDGRLPAAAVVAVAMTAATAGIAVAAGGAA